MVGAADRDLRRTLIERFLLRHVRRTRDPVLEVGPGPGRFTPMLSRAGPTVLLDLSRPMLRAARKASLRAPDRLRPVAFVEGMAEGLRMFRDARFGAIVVVGLFGFFARDADLVLAGAARVLRPGGILVLETQSATGAISELFPRSPHGARKIFRSPNGYYLRRIFEEGYQPYDPPRLARWEYRFWRPAEIVRAVERHGFRARECMSIAPMLGAQPRLLSRLRRDARAWPNVVAYEERAGRRGECFGLGFGFLVAARRRARAAQSRAAARRVRSRVAGPA